MKKRILTILLLAGILLNFVACASSQPSNTTTQQNNSDANNISESTTTDAQTQIVFPHETKDFGGETFNIIVDRENVNQLDIDDFDITELDGEVLNDAVYQRNLEVQEKFNVKLTSFHSDDIVTAVTNAVMSSSADFDAMMPRLMNAGTLASKGMGIELSQQEYISLDQPWWDINATNDLSIGNKVYIIAGDIFYKHYDGTPMMMFNKRILTDYGLDDPYQLVNDGKWTLEKFNEMAAGVKTDLDGNGKFDKEDMFGFSTQADYAHSMLNACGVKYSSKDENDFPVMSINNEKTIEVLDLILEHYVNDTWCLHRDGAAASMSQFWVFPQGHSLFYWGLARYINLGLRDMEDEFGILPLPKYDEAQERYYHLPNNWHSYAYMIPKSTGNVERSTYISDALGYYGRQYILPAYYDSCLTRKYVRDDESAAMLDIIFNSATYDLGVVYGIGGFPTQIDNPIQKNEIDFASSYAKSEKLINKDLEKLIDQFLAIE